MSEPDDARVGGVYRVLGAQNTLADTVQSYREAGYPVLIVSNDWAFSLDQSDFQAADGRWVHHTIAPPRFTFHVKFTTPVDPLEQAPTISNAYARMLARERAFAEGRRIG
jgi:hypothetical protein